MNKVFSRLTGDMNGLSGNRMNKPISLATGDASGIYSNTMGSKSAPTGNANLGMGDRAVQQQQAQTQVQHPQDWKWMDDVRNSFMGQNGAMTAPSWIQGVAQQFGHDPATAGTLYKQNQAVDDSKDAYNDYLHHNEKYLTYDDYMAKLYSPQDGLMQTQGAS